MIKDAIQVKDDPEVEITLGADERLRRLARDEGHIACSAEHLGQKVSGVNPSADGMTGQKSPDTRIKPSKDGK